MTKTRNKQLWSCIEKFGLIDKPIVNSDFTIIGGHQRVRLLLQEGVQECECWVCDSLLSQRDAEELALSLNKKTGDWDWDRLANEFDIESLLASGFEAKDFYGKDKKEPKPRVTFEFDSHEDMERATETIMGISSEIQGCKVRFNK